MTCSLKISLKIESTWNDDENKEKAKGIQFFMLVT